MLVSKKANRRLVEPNLKKIRVGGGKKVDRISLVESKTKTSPQLLPGNQGIHTRTNTRAHI